MEKQLVLVDPKEYGLEEKTGVEIVSGLSVTRSEREVLKQSYNELLKVELTVESVTMFKELRLKIVKNRTQGIEVWHKKNKAFYLAGGRFVDAIRNKEVLENEQMEAKLLEAETHFERIEAERLKILKEERIALLLIVCETPEIYPVEQMTTEAFDNLFEGLKLAKERKEEESKRIEKERIEAEQKAEKERLERIEKERIENERIRIENERLKKEAEAKEKALEIERQKAKAEREKVEREAEIERKKQADILAQKQAEFDKQQQIEKQKQIDLENKLKAEREKEQKRLDDIKQAEFDKQAKELELLKSSDKIRLKTWVDSFSISEIDNSNMTLESIAVLNDIKTKFESYKTWATSIIDKI